MRHPKTRRLTGQLTYKHRSGILLGLFSACAWACAHGKSVVGRAANETDVIDRDEASENVGDRGDRGYADASVSPLTDEPRPADDVGPERAVGIGYRKVGTAILRGTVHSTATGNAGFFTRDGRLMIELLLEPASAGNYAVYLALEGGCSGRDGKMFSPATAYLLGSIVVGNDASGRKWLPLPAIFADVDELAGSTVVVRGEAPESIDGSRGIETLSCGLVEVTKGAQ